MKRHIKIKWLTALRSGEYRKSINTLKRHYSTKPGHCCLGVLCEIIKDEYPHASELIQPIDDGQRGQAKKAKYSMLDRQTQEFCEIPHGTMVRLATLNDNGSQFPAIANYIERTL